MPMPFFSRRPHATLSLPQLANILSETVRDAIIEDPQKMDLLARVLNCRPDAVPRHPRLLAILQRVESLFLKWLDPQTTMTDVESSAQHVQALHDQNGVPPSWLFAVMSRVQDKARALHAPEYFFACSNRFTLTIMAGQEQYLASLRNSLEEEQAYWREIFNTQSEGISIGDLDGHLYDFNDAYANLVGYSREELLQKGWLELTPPEYREEERKRLPEVMAGKTVRLEKVFIHRDGHHIPILISFRLLKRRPGWDKDRLIATHVDLTELKAQQKAMEEERAYWWEIFNTQTEALSIFDLDGGLYDCNEAFANLVGYNREELLRNGWLGLTPPEYLKEDQKQISEAMATGKTVRYEKAYIHRDGHHVPVLISYRLLKRRPGWDKDRLVATSVDLTEAKAREKAMEEERAYWWEIFNTQSEGLCIFDLDGGLYDFNDAYAQLVGYNREELLQKGWLELTAPEYREEDEKRLPDIMAGKTVRFEKAYIHRDGHKVPIFISYRLLKRRPGWDKDRLIATCVDLTETKKREEEMRQLLDNAQTYLQRLAQAQLIHDDIPKDGAARTIQETYNQCVDHLQELVQDISNAAHTLMSLSEELSQSQADLSERSSREAASLEEISANTEEIATTVSENSKHADETRAIAEDVLARLSAAAQSCSAVVDIIMTAARRAQETTAITKAIQDIAFTTNILSLNASVEAARAGAEGKGFAVIAEAIRGLANRAGQESQRAESIIGELVVAMDQGEKGLQAMANAIDNVTAQASTMAEHVAAIASASKEQDLGLQELAKGLNTLEEGLTHNATMAEEIHATSEALTSQTENLMTAIGRFQLDEATSPITPHAPQQDLARIAREAIAAHYRWRQQLLQALQEGRSLDPAQVGDYRHCAFGQIMASNALLKNHPAYQRITQLHQAFHEEGRRIAELLRQRQRQEAKKALLGDSRYNQLTQALAEAIESLTSKSGQSRASTTPALRPPQSGRRHPAQSTPKLSRLDGEWQEF